MQCLVWWLFPSQVQSELQSLKHVTFEMLECLANKAQNQDFSTPFQPKDYNRAKHKFEFCKEWINQSNDVMSMSTDSQEDAAKVSQEEATAAVEEVKEEKPAEDEGPEEGPAFFADFGGDEEPVAPKKADKVKLLKIPFAIQSTVGAAMRDFEMIKDGDKVLVALSGGKDSLALVHILKHFQSVAPIKFEIGAVTIDPMVVEYKP